MIKLIVTASNNVDAQSFISTLIEDPAAGYGVRYKIVRTTETKISLFLASANGYSYDDIKNITRKLNVGLDQVGLHHSYLFPTYEISDQSLEADLTSKAEQISNTVNMLVEAYDEQGEYEKEAKSYVNTFTNILSQSIPDIEVTYRYCKIKTNGNTFKFYAEFAFSVPTDISYQKTVAFHDFECPINVTDDELISIVENAIDAELADKDSQKRRNENCNRKFEALVSKIEALGCRTKVMHNRSSNRGFNVSRGEFNFMIYAPEDMYTKEFKKELEYLLTESGLFGTAVLERRGRSNQGEIKLRLW